MSSPFSAPVSLLHLTPPYSCSCEHCLRVLPGVSVLNRKHELHLGSEEVLYAYSFKWHNLGKYYLVVDAKLLHLVTNLSNISKNMPQGNVLLFGAWGCTKDPMSENSQ